MCMKPSQFRDVFMEQRAIVEHIYQQCRFAPCQLYYLVWITKTVGTKLSEMLLDDSYMWLDISPLVRSLLSKLQTVEYFPQISTNLMFNSIDGFHPFCFLVSVKEPYCRVDMGVCLYVCVRWKWNLNCGWASLFLVWVKVHLGKKLWEPFSHHISKYKTCKYCSLLTILSIANFSDMQLWVSLQVVFAFYIESFIYYSVLLGT